jgi:hypothetical protein
VEYQRSKTVSLKSHPEYNEKWLQSRIVEDPSILGLGDLLVRDVEHMQHKAGRLDLLLSDPETNTRYEVEIQLGGTDESHIIRTIEYWDIERRRYPMYDHVAVIVAEDITSRFLNVVGLFNGFIPLIAVQLRAIELGDVLTLSSTTVLDRSSMVDYEEEELNATESTDRAFWERRGSSGTVRLADEFLSLIQEVTRDRRIQLKYNKHYIGLARDGMADNFVTFNPRKQQLQVGFKMPRSEELGSRVEDSGLEMLAYNHLHARFRFKISTGDVEKHRGLLTELIAIATDGVAPDLES